MVRIAVTQKKKGVALMPIFDYECPTCGHVNEFLVFDTDEYQDRPCENCACPIWLERDKKLPGAPSFKIKGLRAANGYGLKFQDSYGVSKTDGHESGYSFTSNKAETSDYNQGQQRKV